MPRFNIWELLIILAIVLVIFGPGKLPKLGRAIGDTIKGFKKARAEKTEPADEEKE